MTAQEIVLLLSVSIGSLILGACTARKELLEGVYSHWRAVILCIVSDSAEETLPPPPIKSCAIVQKVEKKPLSSLASVAMSYVYSPFYKVLWWARV